MKSIINILFFVLLSLAVKSQDPQFSQVNLTRYYINPAYVGFSKNINFNYARRNQWINVPSKINSNFFSLTSACEYSGLGLGLIGLSNVEGEGAIKTNSTSGIFSYNLDNKFNGKKSRTTNSRGKRRGSVTKYGHKGVFSLSAAIQIGVFQKSIDWSKLVFSDQLDPRYGNINSTQANPRPESTGILVDVGGGTVMRYFFMTKKTMTGNRKTSNEGSFLTLGASFQHLNEPTESFLGKSTRLPARWNIHGNYIRKVQNVDHVIKATNQYGIEFLFQKQDNFHSIRSGFLFAYRDLFLINLGWRGNFGEFKNSDSFITSVMFTFNNPKIVSPKSDNGQISNGKVVKDNKKLTTGGDKISIGFTYDLTAYPLAYKSTFGTFEFNFRYEFTNLSICKSEDKRKKRKRMSSHQNCPSPGGGDATRMPGHNPTSKEHNKKLRNSMDLPLIGM